MGSFLWSTWRKKDLARVTQAGWEVPMARWNTARGWNFTRNAEKVMMSVSLQFNQSKCRKCSELMKAHDKVKEGQGLAGFIQRVAIKMCNL